MMKLLKSLSKRKAYIDIYEYNTMTYCIGTMQAYRMSMEDRYDAKIRSNENVAIFGVFDGHGGHFCSEYLKEYLVLEIINQLEELESNYVDNPDRGFSNKPESTSLDKSKGCKLDRLEGNKLYKRKDGKLNKAENAPLKITKSAQLSKEKLINFVHPKYDKLENPKSIPLNEYIKILKNSFFKVDSVLSKQPLMHINGSTAAVCFILNEKYIIVANTGDSRCILSVNGAAKTLSFDHKPINFGEKIRVENSSGYIYDNRINKILILSRAFGDFNFKKPCIVNPNNKILISNKDYTENKVVIVPPELYQVTVEPDILVYDLQANKIPEFLILATDGVWDWNKNDHLINIIRKKLGRGWSLKKITKYILNNCFSNMNSLGCYDNMTLMIIVLHKNTNLNCWYDQMKMKVSREKNNKKKNVDL